MDSATLWLALGLVLIIEGVIPFLSPANWRKTMLQILQLGDGQLRFFGLCSLLLGMALIWWQS